MALLYGRARRLTSQNGCFRAEVVITETQKTTARAHRVAPRLVDALLHQARCQPTQRLLPAPDLLLPWMQATNKAVAKHHTAAFAKAEPDAHLPAGALPDLGAAWAPGAGLAVSLWLEGHAAVRTVSPHGIFSTPRILSSRSILSPRVLSPLPQFTTP